MIFPSQKPYEKVEAILRRHRIVLFFLFLYSGILAIFGFGVYYLAEYYLNLSSLGFHEFARLILMAYLLMLWQSFFRGLMDYYLDTWIITDHRVIDIHQIGLFKETLLFRRQARSKNSNFTRCPIRIKSKIVFYKCTISLPETIQTG